MPGAIVIAAANNCAWRRQRSGEGSEWAGQG
jgi:hypothetical protein